MCDPVAGKSVVLPEVLHGFPLHISFMKDQVISVTLDGHVTFFRKGLDFRPLRSCTVDTKVRLRDTYKLCCLYPSNHSLTYTVSI